MITAAEALERLRAGNLRFAQGEGGIAAATTHLKRNETLEGQQPVAVILGCSDSRVPVEIVFDQDLGDLFVIRVAGQVVAPSQIGSVEFAAEMFGTRLVVVLGHSKCGAVQSTLDELRRPSADQSPNLRSIVDKIRPSVEKLLRENPDADPAALIDLAIEANVLRSADDLRHGSKIIETLIEEQGLKIVSACYSLETGLVEFLD